MFPIAKKKILNPTVTEMEIVSPRVAKKAKAGQFVILRVDENGERIPLTVAGTDPVRGTVRIIFQTVGATTLALSRMNEGDCLADFVGPLGTPTELDGVKRALVVGGGVGTAIALPIAKALKEQGCEVTSVVGFRTRDLVILEDEFRSASDRFILMTDDGSYGKAGRVTDPIAEMCGMGERFDRVFAIGPLVMMKFVTETCRPYGLPVTVSMNPIMIDGTGMCGGCRLTLLQNGVRVTKFACVDGPDFNGYEVDFDEAMRRGKAYADFERHAYGEACNLYKKAEV